MTKTVLTPLRSWTKGSVNQSIEIIILFVKILVRAKTNGNIWDIFGDHSSHANFEPRKRGTEKGAGMELGSSNIRD